MIAVSDRPIEREHGSERYQSRERIKEVAISRLGLPAGVRFVVEVCFTHSLTLSQSQTGYRFLNFQDTNPEDPKLVGQHLIVIVPQRPNTSTPDHPP